MSDASRESESQKAVWGVCDRPQASGEGFREVDMVRFFQMQFVQVHATTQIMLGRVSLLNNIKCLLVVAKDDFAD